MTVRGIMVGMSLVLLIANALAVHRPLNNPNTTKTEQILAVWSNFFQSLSLVVDFLCLLYAIPGYIGITIVMISVVVSFIVSLM